jgi:preprotein translocase subunit YajC
MNSKKRTQYIEQVKEMQSKFEVGTKVKTYAGIYGEIVAIREALDGTKVITIKSGDGENAMTFDIDIQYISNIDEKDNKEIYDEEYNELKKKMEETTQNLEVNPLKVEDSAELDKKIEENVVAEEAKSENKNKED